MILAISVYSETGRVFLSGYTRLTDFDVFLMRDELFIDEKKIKTKRIRVNCIDKTIIADNKKVYKIKNIKYSDNENRGFALDCIHGMQKYSGDFLLFEKDDKLYLINYIETNALLSSILGSEAGDSFSEEALKAMSIAMRTYYYYKKESNQSNSFDIDGADGRDIVYRGKNYATPKSNKITNMTKNMVLTDINGEIICPLYHSTSSGIILKDEVLTSTIDNSPIEPLLMVDEENGIILPSISNYYNFKEKIPENIVYNALGITDENRGKIKIRYFNNTKCVDFIGVTLNNGSILWTKGYKFISNCQRAGFYNLRSIQFDFTIENGMFYFKGKGFGHLCGMSQWSAENLARHGYKYDYILKKYYPYGYISKIKE